MAMVGVDFRSLYRQTYSLSRLADSQSKSSGLVLGRRLLGAVLHSSDEPGERSQWLCRDDSTINIVLELLLLFIRWLEMMPIYTCVAVRIIWTTVAWHHALTADYMVLCQKEERLQLLTTVIVLLVPDVSTLLWWHYGAGVGLELATGNGRTC